MTVFGAPVGAPAGVPTGVPTEVPIGRRVAVVVPSGNPVVEPELISSVTPALFPYAARFPVHAGLGLEDRLARYVDDLPDVLTTLRGLSVAATYVACTGSSYPLGADGDRSWAGRAALVTGTPVATAAAAVAAALAHIGAQRVHIVSPYPHWLTRKCHQFWTGSGLTIVAEHQIAGAGPPAEHQTIYETAADAVAVALKAAVEAADSRSDRADAVVLAGTGVAALDAIDNLVSRTGVAVVSSNLAGAWWLLTTTGADAAPTHSPRPGLARLVDGRRT